MRGPDFPNARRTQVAIVDSGMGFRQTFVNSPAYPRLEISDREALMLGMAPFITSKPAGAAPKHRMPLGMAAWGSASSSSRRSLQQSAAAS